MRSPLHGRAALPVPSQFALQSHSSNHSRWLNTLMSRLLVIRRGSVLSRFARVKAMRFAVGSHWCHRQEQPDLLIYPEPGRS